MPAFTAEQATKKARNSRKRLKKTDKTEILWELIRLACLEGKRNLVITISVVQNRYGVLFTQTDLGPLRENGFKAVVDLAGTLSISWGHPRNRQRGTVTYETDERGLPYPVRVRSQNIRGEYPPYSGYNTNSYGFYNASA